MTRLLESEDDPLLLIGVDLHEQVRALGGVPQGLLGAGEDVDPREHAIGPKAHEPREVLRHEPAVAGDELDRHPERGQVGQGAGRSLLGPVDEGQEAFEGQRALLVTPARSFVSALALRRLPPTSWKVHILAART